MTVSGPQVSSRVGRAGVPYVAIHGCIPSVRAPQEEWGLRRRTLSVVRPSRRRADAVPISSTQVAPTERHGRRTLIGVERGV